MNPATIIREARADGVRLALTVAGTIKAFGDGMAVSRWQPVIREHKAGIIEALTIQQPSAPLTADDETAIRAWMARIDETDAQIIGDYLDACRHDQEALAYFLKRAKEVPEPVTVDVSS